MINALMIALVAAILRTALELYADKRLYDRAIWVDHDAKIPFRFVYFSGVAALMGFMQGNILLAFSSALLSPALFWFFFDGLYNTVVKRENWWSRGFSSTLDKLLYKVKPLAQLVAFIVALALFLLPVLIRTI